MTLRKWLERPHRFQWGGQGGDDCLMFCASWVAHVTGVDPVEEFRGTYSTREEALALIASHGGIVALVDSVAARAGFKRTSDPQSGDIGIIRAPLSVDGDMAEIGAIKFGPNWACLGERGVVGKQAEFIAAWEIGL